MPKGGRPASAPRATAMAPARPAASQNVSRGRLPDRVRQRRPAGPAGGRPAASGRPCGTGRRRSGSPRRRRAHRAARDDFRQGADPERQGEEQGRGAEGADAAVAHDLEAPSRVVPPKLSAVSASPSSCRAPVASIMVATASIAESQGPRSRMRATISAAAGTSPSSRPASGITRTRRGKLGSAWASCSQGRAGTGRRE